MSDSSYYVGTLVLLEQSVNGSSLTLRTVLETNPTEHKFRLSAKAAAKRLRVGEPLIGVDVVDGAVVDVHTMPKTIAGIESLKSLSEGATDRERNRELRHASAERKREQRAEAVKPND